MLCCCHFFPILTNLYPKNLGLNEILSQMFALMNLLLLSREFSHKS